MYKRIMFLTIIFAFALALGAADYRGGETIRVREIDTLHTDLFQQIIVGVKQFVSVR